MKILLDTHALLWWLADDPRLSGPARTIIADSETRLVWSIASSWEIAVKITIGKLRLKAPLESLFSDIISEIGAELLPITHSTVVGSPLCRCSTATPSTACWSPRLRPRSFPFSRPTRSSRCTRCGHSAERSPPPAGLEGAHDGLVALPVGVGEVVGKVRVDVEDPDRAASDVPHGHHDLGAAALVAGDVARE